MQIADSSSVIMIIDKFAVNAPTSCEVKEAQNKLRNGIALEIDYHS